MLYGKEDENKMKIEVLGKGCSKCKATKRVIGEVIKNLQVDLVEISDINEIADRGIMLTPAVFVDNELKSTGRVPSKEEISGWILQKA